MNWQNFFEEIKKGDRVKIKKLIRRQMYGQIRAQTCHCNFSDKTIIVMKVENENDKGLHYHPPEANYPDQPDYGIDFSPEMVEDKVA